MRVGKDYNQLSRLKIMHTYSSMHYKKFKKLQNYEVMIKVILFYPFLGKIFIIFLRNILKIIIYNKN